MLGQNIVESKLSTPPTELQSGLGDQNKLLIMERDTKDLLEIEYLPFLGFKEKEKDEILAEITKVTELGMSSWTHESQLSKLNKAIQLQKIENDILKAALEDKEIRLIILEMMLFGKYILKYRQPSASAERELIYISQFKEKIRALFAKVSDVKMLIKAMVETGGLFRVLLLAYAEIAEHDKLLLEFRASELVGHNVAYQVAKNENKFDRLRIVNNAGKILEEYAIREIRVMKEGRRDRGLKGIILISNDVKEEAVPTLYISWAGTHGAESISADLERTPGEESFRQGEDQILKQVIAAIEEIGKPVKIMICGHSLGGALSQLLFHSMQRVLVSQMKDLEIQENAIKLEAKFYEALNEFSPHQRDLSDIRLDPSLIREMSVNVWNTAGVLLPVVDHSNDLAKILVKAGIPQYATFGFVDGDVLQSIGHGSILSKVHENGAKIKVLQVESATTKTFMAALGASAALPAGLTIAGSNPIGWIASLFCMGAMFAEILHNTKAAHTKHHFKKSVRPEQGYSVYTSHKVDGSLNSDECKKIHEHLTSRSTGIIDSGLHMISQSHMQEERFKSEFSKVIQLDNKSSSQTNEKTLKWIIARIKSGDATDEVRMIKLLKDKKMDILIDKQDEKGNGLLHHAIENGLYTLASELLDDERINVNALDNEANFALLTFMQKIDTVFPQSQETYKFGVKLLAMTQVDLSFKNKMDQSVERIYRSWYWSGYNAKVFMSELAKRIPLVAVTAAPKVQEEPCSASGCQLK